jgi:hypothetical protein
LPVVPHTRTTFPSVEGLTHASIVQAVVIGKSLELAKAMVWLLLFTKCAAPSIFPAVAVGLLINVPLLPPVESVAVRVVPFPT